MGTKRVMTSNETDQKTHSQKAKRKGKNTVAFVLTALLCVQAEASPRWDPRHFDFSPNSTV